MFAPLRIRNFRMLFTAQVFSDFGNWLEMIALSTLVVYRWELGADAMSAYFVFLCLPYVLFGPFLGALADLVDRRTLMVGSDLARMCLMIGFLFAPNLAVLLGLLFVKGTLTTMFNCAKQGTIRQVVPEELLLPANSLSQTSANLAKFIGPFLGGMLMVVLSIEQVFLVMAAFFLISALFSMRLPALRTPDEQRKGKSYWQELKFGLGYIPSNKALLAVTIFFTVECLGMFAFDPQIAVLVASVGFLDEKYPSFVSMVGIGSVLSAYVVGRWGSRFRPQTLLLAGTMTLGIALLVLAYGGFGLLPVTYAGWLVTFVVVGIGIGGLGVCYGYLLQIATPPEYMGRVYGTFESIVYMGILGGTLLGGAIAGWSNISMVFAYAGVLLIALGILFTVVTAGLGIRIGKQVNVS